MKLQLKSEVLSNVMRIMLTILVAVAILDLIGSLIFGINESFYMDSVYSLFSMISIIRAVLYGIICFFYLVWIWKVHSDLNQLFAQYSRTPGAALAAMIIPIYSLYGLPSTFNQMGHTLAQQAITATQGRRIIKLVAPLITLFVMNYILGRLLPDSSDNAAVFILLSVITLAFYMVCLLLTRYISQSLTLLASNAPEQTNVLSH
ncbi:hypothetical protein [Paenibacillus sp. OV219]|uniref:hypothetical protein n=1 Tax=Paenibacillus sp. OV219 TaxID=1884377 RepID=UPI0008B9FCEF|nr:hypothetical protein [Paenibacillus sp. OV219]SEO47437.1 hypothetical protein SAMN05518847_10820 [Paenibacillus sp. OV219]